MTPHVGILFPQDYGGMLVLLLPSYLFAFAAAFVLPLLITAARTKDRRTGLLQASAGIALCGVLAALAVALFSIAIRYVLPGPVQLVVLVKGTAVLLMLGMTMVGPWLAWRYAASRSAA